MQGTRVVFTAPLQKEPTYIFARVKTLPTGVTATTNNPCVAVALTR